MRLIDCYMDAFAYTLYLLRGNGQGAQSYDNARQEVEGLLEKAGECARSRGYSEKQAHNAKFAVCAWIDEAVLTSSWESAAEWKKLQLQRAYYNTNNAGVEFFERLDALDANDSQVREVYAMCLALGFRGKYFHEDEQPALDEVKDQQLSQLLGDMAKEDSLAGIKLFPEAYLGERKSRPKGLAYRPFDWLSVAIPLVAAVIAVELYLFYDNSLNILLLDFFGAIK